MVSRESSHVQTCSFNFVALRKRRGAGRTAQSPEGLVVGGG